MSTFKFACPNCNQHISVDADQAGARMQCPTCFQNIVVPQAPEEGESKFVLTGTKVSTRVLPTIPDLGPPSPPPKSRIPYAAIAFVVVLGLTLAVGFIFRDQLIGKPADEPETPVGQPTVVGLWKPPARPSLPVTADPEWKLELAGVAIPADTFAGRINGVEYTNQRVSLQGGTLEFREGTDWPPPLGVSIRLFLGKGEALAGRTITITPDAERQPEVVLRWWDDQGQPKSQMIAKGYALRLEFGKIVNRELPGKIYLCTPDDYKSWLAGEFQARVRGPRDGDRLGDPP